MPANIALASRRVRAALRTIGPEIKVTTRRSSYTGGRLDDTTRTDVLFRTVALPHEQEAMRRALAALPDAVDWSVQDHTAFVYLRVGVPV